MTEEQIQKIQDRLNRYYDTNEIDIDLANHIHNDANAMMRVMKHLQQQQKQLIKALERIADESSCDGAGRNLTRCNMYANEAIDKITGRNVTEDALQQIKGDEE